MDAIKPPTPPLLPQASAPPFGRRGIFRFVSLFAICVGAYYVASAGTFFRRTFFPAYLELNAKCASAVLSICGQGTRADGNNVVSSKFMIAVERGCDAVEPTVLFIAAVLASPVAWRSKVHGLILGTLALALVNVVRLSTLFLTGIYWPAAFEVMHVDVWQAIFIFLALLFWVIWALWALKRKPSHVAA